MGLINPVLTVSIQIRRPTLDFGEEKFTDVATVDAVVSTDGKQGTLFVPRGSDVAQGDAFDHHGRRWRVLERVIGDMNQPLTGDDFGWVEYPIGATT